MDFNPRPLRGGRQRGSHKALRLPLISIHAPREGGDTDSTGNSKTTGISIHAPREGGDSVSQYHHSAVLCISIHAPREGGDEEELILHR